MHTFNLQALEFARSHLEDVKQKDTSKTPNVDRIVILRDKEKWTFQQIADHLHCAKSQVFRLYKLSKDVHKPYKKRH